MNAVLHRMCGREKAFHRVHDLVQAINETDEYEFHRQSCDLSDDERQTICVKIANAVRKLGTSSAIEVAALLYLFEQSSVPAYHRQHFKTMEEETGIKRTQLYRLISVHRHLGKVLFAEPQLIGNFVCEALKLLCEASVPDIARETAVEMARDGVRITIAKAQEIRRQYSETSPLSTEPSSEGEVASVDANETGLTATGRWLWRYDSAPFQICITQTKKGSAVSADAIVVALELALKQARQEFANRPNASDAKEVA